MAETTDNEETVSRDEAADLVQAVAQELRGNGPAEIQVGNKVLTLSPARDLEYEIEVEERSPMLGGPHEEITMTLEWEVEKEPEPDS
ncbi:amphi-Trp domain-containing protein [Natronolimnohabitans sp. A-GB9]|uniref:amphi-Trp domain-containing protein n=1 Tax=Natronolimnohabitans sp. A-GB9 TaxID=3069757 RepID=UPI0027ADCF90|nr:amphi-Trp domain-containing protein [Natronolimnohabitans sp. A-GB9]MDQ2048926.1 amphi-Trp domain-containing protein [Natronolimnohabitans sp. A-GB9]